jgi:hypothetical protein
MMARKAPLLSARQLRHRLTSDQQRKESGLLNGSEEQRRRMLPLLQSHSRLNPLQLPRAHQQ